MDFVTKDIYMVVSNTRILTALIAAAILPFFFVCHLLSAILIFLCRHFMPFPRLLLSSGGYLGHYLCMHTQSYFGAPRVQVETSGSELKRTSRYFL